jgi:hypothetical protein
MMALDKIVSHVFIHVKNVLVVLQTVQLAQQEEIEIQLQTVLVP